MPVSELESEGQALADERERGWSRSPLASINPKAAMNPGTGLEPWRFPPGLPSCRRWLRLAECQPVTQPSADTL